MRMWVLRPGRAVTQMPSAALPRRNLIARTVLAAGERSGPVHRDRVVTSLQMEIVSDPIELKIRIRSGKHRPTERNSDLMVETNPNIETPQENLLLR